MLSDILIACFANYRLFVFLVSIVSKYNLLTKTNAVLFICPVDVMKLILMSW
jgi:hypothetical protein